MVDGSSPLLDLDGVVVESVRRSEDGTRLVVVGTAAQWGLPRVRGALHHVHHPTRRCRDRVSPSLPDHRLPVVGPPAPEMENARPADE